MIPSLEPTLAAISGWLPTAAKPLILGICGAQGSGKSTLALSIVDALGSRGMRCATLSLDDLYLNRAARSALARHVHPLLATRGVPLTHDVALGCCTIDAALARQPLLLPRFDKAADEPLPHHQWLAVDHPLDLLIFEGWCVGARPQGESALADPQNALERDEDSDGRWRHAVNTALAGPYQQLFARLDRLVLLAAPDFAIVQQWRSQQEAELRSRLAAMGQDLTLAMTRNEIARFIQHFERISRHIMAEMPTRADLLLHLNADRSVKNAAKRVAPL